MPFTCVTVAIHTGYRQTGAVYTRRSGSVQIQPDRPPISVRTRIGSNSKVYQKVHATAKICFYTIVTKTETEMQNWLRKNYQTLHCLVMGRFSSRTVRFISWHLASLNLSQLRLTGGSTRHTIIGGDEWHDWDRLTGSLSINTAQCT